ncbi:MAG: hypothetical protein ACRDLL_10825 [Solirubrobacterales bacterium]
MASCTPSNVLCQAGASASADQATRLVDLEVAGGDLEADRIGVVVGAGRALRSRGSSGIPPIAPGLAEPMT